MVCYQRIAEDKTIVDACCLVELCLGENNCPLVLFMHFIHGTHRFIGNRTARSR